MLKITWQEIVLSYRVASSKRVQPDKDECAMLRHVRDLGGVVGNLESNPLLGKSCHNFHMTARPQRKLS